MWSLRKMCVTPLNFFHWKISLYLDNSILNKQQAARYLMLLEHLIGPYTSTETLNVLQCFNYQGCKSSSMCLHYIIISAVTGGVINSPFIVYISYQPLQMMFWVFTLYSVICFFQCFKGIYWPPPPHLQGDWLRWMCPLEPSSHKPKTPLFM